MFRPALLRKLQLVAYDDGGDAEKARTFAKRLIEQDKVDVIVDVPNSAVALAHQLLGARA